MTPRRVDLHVHTSVSDGTLAPRAVVRAARDAGLAAIAITDHDTTDGVAEAMDAGRKDGVEIVEGVEISVNVQGQDVHLLGYLFDPAHEALQGLLAEGRDSRDRRNPRIVERLRRLGIEVTMEEVVTFAGASGVAATSIGRPHIAGVLVAKGAVASVREAFDRYLAEGRPAFVPRYRVESAEAIGAIHAAGGLAVLAHAVTLGTTRMERAVRELAAERLDGLEVAHSKHEPETRARLLALAGELGLAPTGGSDFHGGAKPDVAIGTGTGGNVEVPYEWLLGLRARRRR